MARKNAGTSFAPVSAEPVLVQPEARIEEPVTGILKSFGVRLKGKIVNYTTTEPTEGKVSEAGTLSPSNTRVDH